MGESKSESLTERLLGSKVIRSFMIYSAFRAVYGAGILLVTYLLATSEEAPWMGPLGIPSGLDGDLQGNFQVDQEKVASTCIVRHWWFLEL